MTLNDQLREAAEQARHTARALDLPPAPDRPRRRAVTGIMLLGIAVFGAVLWLSSGLVSSPTTTTPVAVPTTTPSPTGVTEVWHHPSRAIGSHQRLGHDFLVFGSKVAVLEGDEFQAMEAVELDSGRVLWKVDFVEKPGNLLAATNDRLVWATYQRVGVTSPQGETLWEHDFGDDGRWPSLALIDGDHLTVALDPVMEGDERPPLIVRFDDSGDLLWITELHGAELDEGLQWTDLLPVEGGLIVQTTDALYRIDSVSGDQVWRFALEDAPVETFGPVGTMVSDGMVYAADPASELSGLDGGEVVGVSVEDGEVHLAFPAARTPRIVGVAGRWLVHTDESGIHAQSLDSRDVWTHTDLGAIASIEAGYVISVSPQAYAMLDADGNLVQETQTQGGTPQLPPIRLGSAVVSPGREGPRAIDIEDGTVLEEWPGSSVSPVIRVDDSNAVIGVSGDGIYLIDLS